MSDLISRSAAREVIRKAARYVVVIPETGRGYEGAVLIDEIMHGFDNLSSIDAVPVVHARWTDDGICTHCGCTAGYTDYVEERFDYDWNENLVSCGYEVHRTYNTTDYCPTCGARMDGDADESE